jgi:hypothetical protein
MPRLAVRTDHNRKIEAAHTSYLIPVCRRRRGLHNGPPGFSGPSCRAHINHSAYRRLPKPSRRPNFLRKNRPVGSGLPEYISSKLIFASAACCGDGDAAPGCASALSAGVECSASLGPVLAPRRRRGGGAAFATGRCRSDSCEAELLMAANGGNGTGSAFGGFGSRGSTAGVGILSPSLPSRAAARRPKRAGRAA